MQTHRDFRDTVTNLVKEAVNATSPGASELARQQLIAACERYVPLHGLDGVDYDTAFLDSCDLARVNHSVHNRYRWVLGHYWASNGKTHRYYIWNRTLGEMIYWRQP